MKNMIKKEHIFDVCPRKRPAAARVVAAVCMAALLASLGGCATWPLSESDGSDLLLQKAVERLFSTPMGKHALWEPFFFPGKRHADFEPVLMQGRPALRVQARSSVSILRHRLEPALAAPGSLSFSWRVNGLPRNADLAVPSRADAAVRVVLAFDGDRAQWNARTHRLSEMSRLLTGEELPHATLIYVWSAGSAPGTVLSHARTDRIRKLVLDGGTAHVGQWRDHVRDVRADFRHAFGEEPGPLRSLALMTDTDNTESELTAWYGALTLEQATD